MKYFNPHDVLSPKEFIEIINILYDGGAESFSLARILWEGGEGYAIRWNVARREWDDPDKINGTKDCVGMPSSHGYPVWFVLPLEFDEFIPELLKKIKTMNLNFEPNINKLKSLINECDDANFNHIIWVSINGDVKIEKFTENNPSDKFEKLHEDRLKFWLGVYYRGNGYVGIEAANDEKYLTELYNQLITYWDQGAKGHILN